MFHYSKFDVMIAMASIPPGKQTRISEFLGWYLALILGSPEVSAFVTLAASFGVLRLDRRLAPSNSLCNFLINPAVGLGSSL
jgi:hypothetical protein